MPKPKPKLEAETEAVRQFYAALNRGDIPATVKILDPQIERVEPPGFPASGTFRGIAAVQEHFTKARAAWAEGACEPRRFAVAGDKVIAFIQVRVRLKHEKEWREGRVTDVFTFRDGKATQFRTFTDETRALEFAGISS